MPTSRDLPTNVIRFRPARLPNAPLVDQKSLLEVVYSAGFLPLADQDRATKLMASRLQVFGFVLIDEIAEDGSLRRLRPSETMHAATERPWRVSKPSYGREPPSRWASVTPMRREASH